MSRKGTLKRTVRHGVGIELEDDELFGTTPLRPQKNLNRSSDEFETGREASLVRPRSINKPFLANRNTRPGSLLGCNSAIALKPLERKSCGSGCAGGAVASTPLKGGGRCEYRRRSCDGEENRGSMKNRPARPSSSSMITIDGKVEKSHRPSGHSEPLPPHQPPPDVDLQTVAARPAWEVRRENLEHGALTVEDVAAAASFGGSGPIRTVQGAPALSSLACHAARTALKNGQTLDLKHVADAHLYELLNTASLSAHVLDKIETQHPDRVAIIDAAWANFVKRTYGVSKLDENCSSWRAVHEHRVALQSADLQRCRSRVRSSYAAAMKTATNGLREVSKCRTPDSELRRRGAARRNGSPSLIEKLRSGVRRDKRRRLR